jgi:hypothetical protein
VDWTAAVDNDEFDHNGYYPDGGFLFGQLDGQNRLYDGFAETMASGQVEPNGVLLATPVFVPDVVGPADEMADAVPGDFALDPSSSAVDAGRVLAGINDGFEGSAPDLGARELGCVAPVYGPRTDETYYTPVNCGVDEGGGDDGGETTGTGGTGAGTTSATSGTNPSSDTGDTGTGVTGSVDVDDGGAGGCDCRHGGTRPLWLALLLPIAAGRRRLALAGSAPTRRRV